MPPKKIEVDPEELIRRKFHVKCRFRALGRLVIENIFWLIEGIEEYKGVEDVKRRVEQAVRAKLKKQQLLSINDKAILNKFAGERTKQEQKHLFRILGGLKCYKRYPNHVKSKLTAVTYFKYFGPNRVIVREHHESKAMYYIVTGDVAVSRMVYDELTQQYHSVIVDSMTAGATFGEASLLHNKLRPATYTTKGHCEMLTLMKEDFNHVLQTSMQKQWDEVKQAMSMFTYFDVFDEVSKREGCIVAKMKSYAQNETLLGDGVGVPNFVYFVLSGRCQMIESLKIIVTTHLGRNFFTLYDPYIAKEESEKDLDQKWFKAYQDKLKQETYQGISQLTMSSVPVSSEELSTEEKPPANLRTFFMQVVIFNPGSTFGFGENMHDRRIIALTPVSCMLLPKVWLLERNTANIWTRIQHFLEKTIPTKKKLFKDCVSSQRWKEFREKMVSDVLARCNTVKFTSVHDVPYTIRLEEMLDI